MKLVLILLSVIIFISSCDSLLSPPESSQDDKSANSLTLNEISQQINSKEITSINELKSSFKKPDKTENIESNSYVGAMIKTCWSWDEHFDENYSPNRLEVCFDTQGIIVYSDYSNGGLTTEGCRNLGGKTILDPGDGSTYSNGCDKGQIDLGGLSVGIEGGICCK